MSTTDSEVTQAADFAAEQLSSQSNSLAPFKVKEVLSARSKPLCQLHSTTVYLTIVLGSFSLQRNWFLLKCFAIFIQSICGALHEQFRWACNNRYYSPDGCVSVVHVCYTHSWALQFCLLAFLLNTQAEHMSCTLEVFVLVSRAIPWWMCVCFAFWCSCSS